MAILKNPRLWSNLVLIAGIACVISMILSLVGIRLEWFGARDAGGYIRYGVQAGIFILGWAVVVIVLARKNMASVVKSVAAFVIVLTPLLIAKTNMPEGTAIFSSGPPSGPPSGATNRVPPSPEVAPINDISTDTVTPPLHVASISLRPTTGNNLPAYGGESVAAIQAVQFPDIKSIETSRSKTDAFNRALDIAADMNWEIIAQDPAMGTFEAVASTVFFNYKDDVVVRVKQSGEGSIVDIRSHSREGRGDRGKNAQRVRSFVSKFGV